MSTPLSTRGYFGIAMYHPKNNENWGSLVRTNHILGGKFMATIGMRFKPQPSDTMKSWKHCPQFHYEDIDDFLNHLPKDCRLVGVEMDDSAIDLKNYRHPERAVYLLGAEDYGLPKEVMNKCHDLIKLKGDFSMNVSVTGSIVLYDRVGLDRNNNKL